ncbi:hypothetical protein RQX57_004351 [Vibrio vulnificus]|uniref:hypothetical protein n=1 Tax=Vibrio vulnificus TaxID=672 RepID=UPI002894ABDC|nr:hypothetical protein [Vibrio vulnificus]
MNYYLLPLIVGRLSYDDNDFTPTSCISEIVWKDDDIYEIEALDLFRGGAFNVTKPIAELIMSFDPYGVEVYPALLRNSRELNQKVAI